MIDGEASGSDEHDDKDNDDTDDADQDDSDEDGRWVMSENDDDNGEGKQHHLSSTGSWVPYCGLRQLAL